MTGLLVFSIALAIFCGVVGFISLRFFLRWRKRSDLLWTVFWFSLATWGVLAA